MLALDRAKRVQGALTKLVERRERLIQRAAAEFRLDLLAAIDAVDDETLALVQRGLAMDRCEAGLQYALQIAIDERNELRRRARGEPEQVDTRRSGEDLHEAETLSPPPLPNGVDDGDEDLTVLDELCDAPFGEATVTRKLHPLQPTEPEPELPDGYRYPEPGEPAMQLPDGRIVAALP